MKITTLIIHIKGENELRKMTRKEFIDYIDNDVNDNTTIEIIEVGY